jgi:hypothetical protein
MLKSDGPNDVAPFRWTTRNSQAAIALADGQTQRATAAALNVHELTISRWMQHPDFSAEVDRLTLMMGIASRAERLRIAKRLVKERVRDEHVETDKDLLDWLKFAQSETDGIRLDLPQLAAFLAASAPLAGGGPDGLPAPADGGAAAGGGAPGGPDGAE